LIETSAPAGWDVTRSAPTKDDPAAGRAVAESSRPRDAAVEKSLGSRQMSGVYTVGRRLTLIVPIAQIGNDRPIEVSEERWESPELNIVIYSRLSDPRIGVIEYRLSNVRRADPPAELFVVPSDYTIVGSKGPWLTLENADAARGTSAQPKRPR
jgi:hypothetical protein